MTDEWRKGQSSIFSELEKIHKKIDMLNEQITILRIDAATSKLQIKDVKKFQSSIWGVIGGAVSAIMMSIVESLFKK